MKRLVLIPLEWPCTISECPPGYFLYNVDSEHILGFKSEYAKLIDGETICDAFNEAGEYMEDRVSMIVQPVEAKWEEYEVSMY